jgi:hypothetical protein
MRDHIHHDDDDDDYESQYNKLSLQQVMISANLHCDLFFNIYFRDSFKKKKRKIQKLPKVLNDHLVLG